MRFSLLIATFVLAASTLSALADTFTYTYTGHDFTQFSTPYTTSDFISGSFTLAAPVPSNQSFAASSPVQTLSFSFTDGVQTIDNVNANPQSQFFIGTDSSGAINAWDISLLLNGGQSFKQILMEFDGNGRGQDFAENVVGDAVVENNPGKWVETVNSTATPEPSTLALFGTGILGLAGVARRKLS